MQPFICTSSDDRLRRQAGRQAARYLAPSPLLATCMVQDVNVSTSHISVLLYDNDDNPLRAPPLELDVTICSKQKAESLGGIPFAQDSGNNGPNAGSIRSL